MYCARILLLTAPLATALPLTAGAHSWYPNECCSNRDCMAADRIDTDARGDRIVVVGELRIWIPPSLSVRSSPDHRVHICFRVIEGPQEHNFTLPFCLFLPAHS